jgi:DNA-binding NarL/FixJ family response regulator
VSVTRTALIADRQPMFRAGLAAALRRAGIEVVAEASNTVEAVAAATRLAPGVCVLDSSLPGGTIAATKRISALAPETLVVVLGPADDDELLVASVRAGASGYLPRSTSVRGLARALEAVLDGSAAITRTGVTALVRELRSGSRQRSIINGAGVSLTEREARVAELLRDGLGTREIADELGLSPITVRRHLGTLGRKIGAKGREELLRTLRES